MVVFYTYKEFQTSMSFIDIDSNVSEQGFRNVNDIKTLAFIHTAIN